MLNLESARRSSEPEMNLLRLQIADEQVSDRGEQRQPDQAPTERGILGDQGVDLGLDHAMEDVSRQCILAEGAEQTNPPPAWVARKDEHAVERRREPGREQ